MQLNSERIWKKLNEKAKIDTVIEDGEKKCMTVKTA